MGPPGEWKRMIELIEENAKLRARLEFDPELLQLRMQLKLAEHQRQEAAHGGGDESLKERMEQEIRKRVEQVEERAADRMAELKRQFAERQETHGHEANQAKVMLEKVTQELKQVAGQRDELRQRLAEMEERFELARREFQEKTGHLQRATEEMQRRLEAERHEHQAHFQRELEQARHGFQAELEQAHKQAERQRIEAEQRMAEAHAQMERMRAEAIEHHAGRHGDHEGRAELRQLIEVLKERTEGLQAQLRDFDRRLHQHQGAMVPSRERRVEVRVLGDTIRQLIEDEGADEDEEEAEDEDEVEDEEDEDEEE